MSLLTRCYITALVIRGALVPFRSRADLPGVPGSEGAPAGYRPVPLAEIASYLADLGRTVNADGSLKLFFPGCLALAAPALLFRLKREGYSNCRATATTDGLLVDATR
ncbi:MAG TPA: hypothetical protein VI298_09765 [Geobacteraceae bacterium]